MRVALTWLSEMHRRANSPGDQWLAGKERLLEGRKLTLAVVQKPGADQRAILSTYPWSENPRQVKTSCSVVRGIG